MFALPVALGEVAGGIAGRSGLLVSSACAGKVALDTKPFTIMVAQTDHRLEGEIRDGLFFRSKRPRNPALSL